MFKIGISKERVMSLKQHFVEIGRSEGIVVGKSVGLIEVSRKAAKEEALKFCYEDDVDKTIEMERKRRMF